MSAAAASAVADWGQTDMGSPTTNYAVFFWDHGWMWRPDCSMRDDGAQDGLNEDELVSAMSTTGVAQFGIVGWDCCERMTAEVAPTLRPYAQSMQGSEEDTWWEGEQYGAV